MSAPWVPVDCGGDLCLKLSTIRDLDKHKLRRSRLRCFLRPETRCQVVSSLVMARLDPLESESCGAIDGFANDVRVPGCRAVSSIM